MATPSPDLATLARQIRRVEDRQLLSELISRYGTAVDDRDFETLARLFTPDGSFQHVQGRNAVVDFYRERLAAFTTSTHYAHGQHLDFETDDRARGVVNAHAELCIGGKAIRLSLRYLDVYVRATEGWQFAERKIQFRYVLPFDELSSRIGEPLRVRWPGTEPQAAELPDQLESYRASLRR
jgi:hypothetical protein